MELTQNKYEFQPKVSIGPVQLGASRAEVLGLLGQPDASRPKPSGGFCDFYFDRDLTIGYLEDRCRSVEVSDPRTDLLLNGVSLLHMNWPDLYGWLQEEDPALREDSDLLCISPKLGLSTGPKYQGSQEIESIFAFGEDYRWPTEAEFEAAAALAVDQDPSTADLLKELGLTEFVNELMT